MEDAARNFGAWLKAKRKSSGAVMRVFAGPIALSPAEYAEVELGIVHWVKKEQESLISENLALSDTDKALFATMLTEARKAPPLSLKDIYSPEQLSPLRTRSNGSQLTERAKAAIMDAVFTPLS